MRWNAVYVLWDQETRNLLLGTADEAEVISFVRRTIEVFDDSAVLHWTLYGEDGSNDEQSATLIAQGYKLAAYASGQDVPKLTPA